MKHIRNTLTCNTFNRICLAAAIIALSFSIVELLLYAQTGSLFLFAQIPKFEGHQFFDLYIWSANLADCKIPIKEITPTNHCGLQYYIFGQPKYPLYLLRLLGLQSQFHNLYGFLMGTIPTLGFSILIALEQASKPIQYRGPLFLTIPIALFSFQFRYALERGQTDLFIAGLYLVACLLFSVINRSLHNRPVLISQIVLFSALATITKLYSFSILLALLLLCAFTALNSIKSMYAHRRRQVKQQLSELLILSSFLSIITFSLAIKLYDSYSYIKSAAFTGLDNGGFGLTVLVDAPYTKDSSLTLGSKIAVMITTLILVGISSTLNKDPLHNPFSRASFPDIYTLTQITPLQLLTFLSIITIIPVYLVTESFPYKYIFIPLALPGLIETSLLIRKTLPYASEAINFICFLILLSLYLPYLPYSPSISQHLEWFVHFFLHPAITGGLAGSIWGIFRSTDPNLTSA